MAINFPPTPVLGEQISVGYSTWKWDGEKWIFSLPPSTGGGGRAVLNRVMNGDMMVDQYRNGATVNATAPANVASGSGNQIFGLDRWRYGAARAGGAASAGTIQRSGAFPLAGFPYCLAFNYASITLGANDFTIFLHRIEADTISDFLFGTPTAKDITLSFWVNASVANFRLGGTLQGANRYFPFLTPAGMAANTWTFVSFTVPGDTAGTWPSGSGFGLMITFGLSVGANFLGPPDGTWQGGAQRWSATGASNNASVRITGVQIELGDVANPFVRDTPAKKLSDCQRYYQPLPGYRTTKVWTSALTALNDSITLNNPMRAAPTATYVNRGIVPTNNATLTLSTVSASQGLIIVGSAWSNNNVTGTLTYDVSLSAEL